MSESLSVSNATKTSEGLNIRGIIAFPSIDDFYNELMDRLHMVLDQFFLEEDFTIFINGLPRDHEPGTKIYVNRFDLDAVKLVYGGTMRQRQFIENDRKESIINLEKSWESLKEFNLIRDKSKVSFTLYSEFRSKDFSLSDIETKCTDTLLSYFKPELGLDQLTKEQQAEYAILNQHFRIEDYRYLSLPLIQFAEFDGVVHIILSEKDYQNNFIDKDSALSKRVVGNVIKAFSREYEGLILDWDIVGDAQLKRESFMDALNIEKFYSEESNPILIELGYREYYEKHRTYFEDRLRYSGQVPLNLRLQYRQVAVIHILIDSYAHNISAHSLTALEWWFRQRADMQFQKQVALQEGKPIPPPSADMNPKVALLDNYEALLDKEIHPLLRFLLDKGAFWTGLTRDNSFGGRIISLYNVLWRDFINNPLYLGTIAFTEGIVKLHIRITFLKYKGHEGNMRIHKEVELDGVFAHIDLTKFQEAKTSNDKKDLENSSDFVIEGNDYEKLSEKLRSCKAFFPAGVVGEHAFFTILETELRNVKHYSTEDLVKIRDQGLTLHLSIEESGYRSTEDRQAPKATHYYKIGVWLGHPMYIDQEKMMLRPKKLNADIIEEETFLPRLGGTFQDKVCAAMLFNNSFASVENQDTERDQRYYPWVKSGSSSQVKDQYEVGEMIEDFEVSARRLLSEDGKFVESKEYFEKNFKPHKGYFKKFFHIWKGENIYKVENIDQLNETWENVSRFRFVYIPSGDAKLFLRVREMGIIRTINTPTENDAVAYHEWLKKWLKWEGKSVDYRVEFRSPGTIAAQIDVAEDAMIWRNKVSDIPIDIEEKDNTQYINFIHSPNQQDDKGKDAVRYRSHGIFKEYFCNRKDLKDADISLSVAAELLETIATRICIFDNRIAGRFKEINTKILTDQLHCTVYGEDETKWQEERKAGFFRYNFLVVHLSFIEALKDDQGNKLYDEKNIQSFIDNEILQGAANAPVHFILVITTGRGRTHWWDKLKSAYNLQRPEDNIPPYTSFVTFRPVESLTASIENAITLKDDIELKYRLTKVLFGS